MSHDLSSLLAAWVAGDLDAKGLAALHDSVGSDDPATLRAAAEGLALLAPAVLAPTSGRDRLLAAVAPFQRFAPLVARTALFLGDSERRARSLLKLLDDPDAWVWPTPEFGLIHIRPSAARAGLDVGFIAVAPGAAFPRHSHKGDEDTLVLEGLLDHGAGSHGVGALLRAGVDDHHDVRNPGDGRLVYLAATPGIRVDGWPDFEVPDELLR
jgi:putative transcriptional regulator